MKHLSRMDCTTVDAVCFVLPPFIPRHHSSSSSCCQCTASFTNFNAMFTLGAISLYHKRAMCTHLHASQAIARYRMTPVTGNSRPIRVSAALTLSIDRCGAHTLPEDGRESMSAECFREAASIIQGMHAVDLGRRSCDHGRRID